MDIVNVHDVDIDTSKVKIFLEECMIGLKNENRPNTYFNKSACQNIPNRLLERTGKDLDINQMKNKWDIMRKKFKYYDCITRLETGILTDPVRNIISTSKEWWDDKIKYAKFKDKNLDVYQSYYEALFRDTIAVGDKAKVPCKFGDGSTQYDVQFVDITDGKEDTDEVRLFDDVDPFLTYDSSSKKRRGTKLTPRRDNKRKFKGKSMANLSYEEKLDTVFDVLQTISSSKTEDCMTIVSTFPGFEEGSIGYLKMLEVFLKKSAIGYG
uniref:Myb/SANT-like domain-containing protein n=1 Tax=Lactuca sativa TaxID=4236 RepID=A0A9R1VCW1_LACSA|nr:hypothetical protein LSAT_V11C500294160 [Lactuca sativa]